MRERLRQQESLTPSEKVGRDSMDQSHHTLTQVSIWHRDITLVTPSQMKPGQKGGQKYSQYQRQARTRSGSQEVRQSRQSSRQHTSQARHSSQPSRHRNSSVVIT